MEDLVTLPQNQNALVGTLPEIQRGNILVRVVPDDPAALNGPRDLGQNKCENLAETVDEHCAVGLENAETLLNPGFGPLQIFLHRLFVAVIAEVFADILGRVGDDNLGRGVLQSRQNGEAVALKDFLLEWNRGDSGWGLGCIGGGRLDEDICR